MVYMDSELLDPGHVQSRDGMIDQLEGALGGGEAICDCDSLGCGIPGPSCRCAATAHGARLPARAELIPFFL